MAYDEGLAGRVHAALQAEGPTVEKRMFGGLGFLVHGHMPCCVAGSGGQGDGLLVRVPEADGERYVAEPGVEWMQMGAQVARTWVHVPASALTSDDELAAWVGRGLAVVRSLPPKD